MIDNALIEDTGLEVNDLAEDQAFARRNLPPRHIATEVEALRRLTRAFVDSPDTILQELVNAAVELADFAAMAVRHQRQQNHIMQQARSAAGMEMAHELAHRINNPLQGLTNLIYLAAEGSDERTARELGQDLSPMLKRLSALVTTLLALPISNSHRAQPDSDTPKVQHEVSV